MSLQQLFSRARQNHSQQWYTETFDTDKTTDWGVKRLDGSTLTLTNKSAQGKLGCSSTGYNSAIEVTNSPAKSTKIIKAQIDIVTANNGGGSGSSFGFSLWTGTYNVITVLYSFVDQKILVVSANNTTVPTVSSIVGPAQSKTIPTTGVHEFKLTITPATGSNLDYSLYIDNTLLYTYTFSAIPNGTLIRSGPYMRNTTVDLMTWQENL